MPHCWPQKQQWVFTSFSPLRFAESTQPPGGTYLSVGPYCRLKVSTGCGGLAMQPLLGAQLCERERLSFARLAYSLPMLRWPGDRKVKAQLRQHLAKIVNLHLRRETGAAARTDRCAV